MKIPPDMPRLKGFRFPREIIAYAVWAYYRFALSTADVEDLLAERGVIVSHEAIRLWVNRFGRLFADCIKRERPGRADKWHLDEVVIMINGEKFWLRPVLFVSAQRSGVWLEPQAGLSDLLRAGVKPAYQAQETLETGQTRASGRA